MFRKLKLPLRDGEMWLHDRRAEIPKLTPAKLKQLAGAMDSAMLFVRHALVAPKDDFQAYMLEVTIQLMDEIVEITSILSGIEAEYLNENVGADELANYLIATFKKNDFATVIKNVKSLPMFNAEK